MPNLEQLELYPDYNNESVTIEILSRHANHLQFPKLKSLTINSKYFREFVKNTDITSLYEFKNNHNGELDLKVLQMFMNRQKCLRNFKFKELPGPLFTVNSIDTSNVKFYLKCIKLCIDTENYEEILSLLNTQTECLEELKLDFPEGLISEDLAICLNKFKKLQKFAFSCKKLDIFQAYPFLEMKTVKSLDIFNDVPDFKLVFERLPSLEHFKLCSFGEYGLEGTFDKLTSLEFNNIDLGEISYAKFPNLKNFKVLDKLYDEDNIEDSVETDWNNIAESIPNIENIWIQLTDENFAAIILKNLKRFDKLKTFFYRSNFNYHTKM